MHQQMKWSPAQAHRWAKQAVHACRSQRKVSNMHLVSTATHLQDHVQLRAGLHDALAVKAVNDIDERVRGVKVVAPARACSLCA